MTFVGGEPLCYDLYAINGLPRKLTYVRAEIEWFRKPIPRIGEMIGQTLRTFTHPSSEVKKQKI